LAIVFRISNRDLGLDEKFEVADNTDIIVGRNEDCDYHIPDDRCSGRHLQLSVANDAIWAIDLNSKNGTLLDKAKIEEEQVFIGTKIEIGNSKIVLDSKYMDSEEKKIYTRRKLASDGGALKNDLSLSDDSFNMEFTNAGMSINQANGYNDGDRGLALPKKKKGR
jgi:pSer/pThr/pTyr-binding forkhead associated (FHA) protein